MKRDGLNIALYLLLTAAFSLAAAAGAAPLEVKDFAYGIRLEPRESGAVYRLDLPEAVYRKVARQDLGDIRVFNVRGEMVPHTLRSPLEKGSEERAPRSLPFFVVDHPPGEPGKGLSIDITTDGKGAILSARSLPGTGGVSGVRTYLIDAGEQDLQPDRLRFDWRGPGDGLVAEVRLFSSGDLDHWRVLVPAATLASLRYGKHTLHRDVIPLPKSIERYISIQWPEHARETVLTRVEALFPRMSKIPHRRCRRAPFAPVEGEPNVYTADLGGFFPVDRLNVVMNEANSVAAGRLYSRSDLRSGWKRRFEGLFYDLRVDGARLRNDEAAVARVSDRWWRLEVFSEDGGMGRMPPELSVGWVPLELLFLARGGGPFTVAWGHASVDAVDQDPHPLFRLFDGDEHEKMIRWIEAGETFPLRGDAALIPPKPPFPWKTWLLWSVLGIAVILLSVMACRLYRQMNPPPSS